MAVPAVLVVADTKVGAGGIVNVTVNPVPDVQAKTAVFPELFVPSVGNVVGNPAFVFEISDSPSFRNFL